MCYCGMRVVGMQRRLVIGALVVAALSVGAAHVRRPAAAGHWYPRDPLELRLAVQNHLSAAEPVEGMGKCVALIVPHGGYEVCGAVSGQGYRQLIPDGYDRVVVLTASHHMAFRGCSIPTADIYRTPLGDVAVDRAALDRLDWSPFVSTHTLRYNLSRGRIFIHEYEHGIEVVLPFLQVQLGAFRLAPVVVGKLEGIHGGPDEAAIEEVADALKKVVDDRTLVVVTSNLTQYGNRYSYRPFKENVIERIKELDARAVRHIVSRDVAGFRKYLDETGNPIDGANPIAMLIKALPADARGMLLGYTTTGRKELDMEPTHSVSYAAIGFFRAEGEGAKR